MCAISGYALVTGLVLYFVGVIWGSLIFFSEHPQIAIFLIFLGVVPWLCIGQFWMFKEKRAIICFVGGILLMGLFMLSYVPGC
jgi:hypothetical protein